MREERVVYRERWHWAPWVSVLLWGSMVACITPLLAGWGTDGSLGHRLFMSGAIVVVYLFIYWFFGGTTILVKPTELQVFLGTVPLVRKRVPYEEIASLEVVKYHPMREFGGWGVRGFGQKQAWTARGDQAVVLHLVTGKQLYIGSDTPRRLEERIRSTAGSRLAGNA